MSENLAERTSLSSKGSCTSGMIICGRKNRTTQLTWNAGCTAILHTRNTTNSPVRHSASISKAPFCYLGMTAKRHRAIALHHVHAVTVSNQESGHKGLPGKFAKRSQHRGQHGSNGSTRVQLRLDQPSTGLPSD